MLVRVNDLVFLAEFYILNMEGGDMPTEVATTVIFGRPFLKIVRTEIDVQVDTLIMEFADSLVQFNILDAMKHLVEDYFMYHLDILDDIVDDSGLELLGDFNLIDCTNAKIDMFKSSDNANSNNSSDAGSDINALVKVIKP